jgi:MoxR-like ATPase
MSVAEHRTVSPGEARSRVLRCFKNKRPVFLWGPPGIGKSELVADLAAELGGYMIDLRLGQMEPTDIRGIPFFNKTNEKMDWAPPIDLPDAELASQYPIVVLFLDEMNSAAPSVQAAGYQLILNRRVGKYVLPDNVVIVAAGNRESDKGVSYRMPSPLANRFVHLEVKCDFDSWFQWAVNHNIHQDVVGYIGFAKQALMDFDPKSASRAFATPRSWSFVSDFLQDQDASDAELTDLIAGTVGEGTAVSFMAHRKVAGQMPKPEDVLSYELQDQYRKLGKEKLADWHAQADNFLGFMMANFSTELVVMGARVALTTYNLPMVPGKMKNFDEFHKRFGKYIIAASGK